ncbi:MAG: sortase [Clostridia bacterium]|nr:sortase [Clostridia bacterium]
MRKINNKETKKDKDICKKNIKKQENKSKLTLILQILLLFAISVFVGMLLFDFHSSKVMDSSLSQVVDELDKKIEENQKSSELEKEVNDNDTSNGTTNQTEENPKNISSVNKPIKSSVRIGNSTVFGKIKIDKIGIEYPIIEYINDDSLWKSICKISNNSVNGTGNLCLAGHNMRNMTMFAKIKNLKVGDIVEITNIYGNKYIYEVYESFYVDPTEVEVLKNTSESIVTMITCNNTSSKRLIVRAKLK